MSAISTFPSLRDLVTRLRIELHPTKPTQIILIFAYNRTGKTRLSMDFKNAGKAPATFQLATQSGELIGTQDSAAIEAETVQGDTLYFNAYTEDLFTWDNDLYNDTARHLRINPDSAFFNGLKDLALDQTIAGYLDRYADFDFDIDYTDWKVSFRKGDADNIKISRGEQNIFIWCLFMSICERMLDGHVSYQSNKYLYIDDPISSLDDNNAIAVACDLAELLRRAASRKDAKGNPAPIKVVLSTHHALFFNVMCNEIGRAKDGEPNVKHKRYFLHRASADETCTLRDTSDAPFFHHVATLAELQLAADPASGKLYTSHFNALRSILEKTASFFGHTDIGFCLKALDNQDSALYNRALNLLSHGKYSIYEPTEMGDDNKALFRRILRDFTDKFQFSLPEIVQAVPGAVAATPVVIP